MTKTISPVAALWIRRWLILIGLMVYAMILIGGATRLTDSGLSITEWDPIKGTLPPFGEASWLAEFEKYKATAEFQLQNYNMTLAEFKYIYWWEWGHRLFGRLIGLIAIGGFIWFAAKRWLTKRWAIRLLVLIALGGLQGAIGWWMVASGIGETTRVDVAPYRLATHFGLALLIIGVTAWFWLDLKRGAEKPGRQPGYMLALCLLVLISIQMFSGALVAGLDAGRSYTDWPLMSGQLVPSPYLYPDLGLRSLFEGRAATQFNHRFLAYLIWALSIFAAIRYRAGPLGRRYIILACLVTAQAVWGILTLVSAAPLMMALVHQGLGVITLLASLELTWQLRQAAPGEIIQTPQE
ncbi:MAG: COX15/CtaA family protein [Henriciella sp.]